MIRHQAPRMYPHERLSRVPCVVCVPAHVQEIVWNDIGVVEYEKPMNEARPIAIIQEHITLFHSTIADVIQIHLPIVSCRTPGVLHFNEILLVAHM